MITKDNLRDLLSSLGFNQSDTVQDEMNKHFDNSDYTVAVNFTNEKIIYPEGVEADRDTTKNFSANENFVVLECVVGLLAQGYKPENIVLEPKTPGGREDSHFYCDILIHDNDKRPYMLIECKTMDGKEDDEFNKAWKKTLQDGGQLFNYYNTYRQAQYLVLYASDFVDSEPRRNYHLITMTDNKEYLESNPKLLSYEKVSADNGTRDDFFKVWSETYGKDSAINGAFEVDEVPAFGVTKKKMTIDDLIIVDGQDIQRKYHQFAQTLRQYNVASHENAFDKLVNLFLVKVVDEVRNPKDLQFLWKGAAYDDYYSFQDRLQKLYQIGMKDYLGEDVTYIDNASIENAFRSECGSSGVGNNMNSKVSKADYYDVDISLRVHRVWVSSPLPLDHIDIVDALGALLYSQPVGGHHHTSIPLHVLGSGYRILVCYAQDGSMVSHGILVK